MTCGIYLLRFNGTDKVYVGQALDIEKRYLRHVYTLRTNEGAKKLQEAYKLYGVPKLEILTECEKSELYKYESEAIEIFNSVNNGFNTVDALQHAALKGDEHGMAKYSNEVIESVFFMLCNYPHLRQIDVADELDVSLKVVNLIASGISHKWLKDKYPFEYTKLMVPRKTGPKNNWIFSKLVSPEGQEYVVTSATKFAREHGLDQSSVNDMLLGRQKKTRSGWTAK